MRGFEQFVTILAFIHGYFDKNAWYTQTLCQFHYLNTWYRLFMLNYWICHFYAARHNYEYLNEFIVNGGNATTNAEIDYFSANERK